ncbi:DUF2637 domain-containing protein [Streptomyces sp. H10-C2]|uniref:DUF2637 domain-containing protein n=1 Tax=unclassified Streptomyces TaxID=2593676 RepID=UPI0024BA6861|nr:MULTISPECIES: DUF2637 domain-containing protein [unclassified Streptomyces]MDJ0343549.1 DUF2637 domain-containing protein [Streptomyces sp. PH10-H1]MDJ0368875.1 DUF2637 domain-containing protein [Streptomyces sp. H10-C2]
MAAIRMTRTHRILIGVVVAGAVVIAAIGFAGSYAAVRELARAKGFGWFANVFPIGVDAGIVVLLSLDLLLTWLRIPFPLLRQTAWLLTAATIAFNGAAAWPDPVGVGMHGIIPVLFVVCVEAARHAVGRVADLTADKHMESVRLTRWLLAPFPTFRLWRRMKLWELRSYDQVIRLEQDRLVYQARLQARYGRTWRRKAPIEALMPLRLARYGIPLAETATLGLAAAGITLAAVPAVASGAPEPEADGAPDDTATAAADVRDSEAAGHEQSAAPGQDSVDGRAHPGQQGSDEGYENLWFTPVPVLPADADGEVGAGPAPEPEPEAAAPPTASGSGSRLDTIYAAFVELTDALGQYPTFDDLSKILFARYNVSGRAGQPMSPDSLRRYAGQLRERYEDERSGAYQGAEV